jgi:hypothetical protein
MTVTGKHKEILVELLIYHLTNSRYGMNEEFLTTIIESIKKQNMAGDYWMNEFIDRPNAYWWNGQEFMLDDCTNENIK